jgi:hypothetical protein
MSMAKARFYLYSGSAITSAGAFAFGIASSDPVLAALGAAATTGAILFSFNAIADSVTDRIGPILPEIRTPKPEPDGPKAE